MFCGRNVLVGVVLVAATAFLLAADDKKTEGGAAAGEDNAAMAAKMMETWMKLGQPGKEHERLKMLEGKFDADVTMQMMPGMPEEKSKGTADNKTLFDGRYLMGEYKGTFGGQPFEGHQLFGYDNAKKKYFSGWIDSMSTMVMMSEGDADSSGKVITTKCEMTCPVTNKPMKSRMVLTIEDADHHTFESYSSLDGSPEHKSMTIKYTKAK